MHLGTNGDLCPFQHEVIIFWNRDSGSSLHSTKWVLNETGNVSSLWFHILYFLYKKWQTVDLQVLNDYKSNGICRVYTKECAVSKVNNKFISHLTRTQRTPSVAATVQVSHALQAARFSCLLRGRGASFQDGVAAGKGFLCAPYWGVQICDYSAAWVSCSTV